MRVEDGKGYNPNLDIDDLFGLFTTVSDKVGSSQPYDLITLSEGKFEFRIAVPGFNKRQISLANTNGLLTITAERDSISAESCQHLGIVSSIKEQFKMCDGCVVTGTRLLDGVLSVYISEDDNLKEINIPIT